MSLWLGILGGQITAPAAVAEGGAVTDSGGYRYHTFNTSGTFSVLQAVAMDYLVVAGGGGAGNPYTGGIHIRKGTGGGGAGQYMPVTAASLSAGDYPVIVGAGGAAATTGSYSLFAGTFADGGGRGADTYGNNNPSPGGQGGSGGGGAQGGAGGLRSGQGGNDGGVGGLYNAGGGGGAGSAGTGGDNTLPHPGGNGLTWVNGVTYAGGGGGGGGRDRPSGSPGGSGGGGAGGGDDAPSFPGVANTGGGAGGCSPLYFLTFGPDSGGSGVVIIRYAI